MTALDLIEEIHRLMKLKGENPFKVRAFERATTVLAGREDLAERAKNGTLTDLEGIGKGIAEVLTDFLVHHKTPVLDDLKKGLPPGLVELNEIPGLGPKKALQLIEELGIQSVSELEYACRENRLLKLKGFGPKVQAKILEGIQFQKSTAGLQRLVDAFPMAEGLIAALTEALPGSRVSETGALRRRMEILSQLDFLIEGIKNEAKAKAALAKFEKAQAGLLPVHLHFAESHRFGYELAKTTGTDAHWKALGSPAPFECSNEDGFFEKLGLPLIPPEARETGEEVALARAGKISKLLTWNGLKGVFHNHTTRSDGAATLEQMVVAAKKLGYDYIGISDHSQSAFYAQGLKPDTLLEQEREIRALQDQHPEIRIFWGIESDILQDGELDYDQKMLKRFDFVIGSVHSRFKMDKEAMTDRILTAIRNPSTRFIGHLTGRLLLGRAGYDLHMEKILAEAAQHDVAIELNSHPARLDIDWRWGAEMRARGTKTSINPDAHEVAGLEDTRYGIAMARKALLPTDLIINTRSAAEVEKWLKRA